MRIKEKRAKRRLALLSKMERIMWSNGEKAVLYVCLGIWGVCQIIIILAKTGLLPV